VLGYQVRHPQPLILHLLNQTQLPLPLLTLRTSRPHLCVQHLSQLRTFNLVHLNFLFTNLNKHLVTFLEILLPPLAFFFDTTF
jgi:hypothetical protein